MGFMFWLRIILLLTGAGLAVYGGFVVATGRVSDRSRAAFRSVRDAGMYPLCSGLALVCLALGQWVTNDIVAVALTFLALTLVGIAFALYRPRRQPSGPGNR